MRAHPPLFSAEGVKLGVSGHGESVMLNRFAGERLPASARPRPRTEAHWIVCALRLDGGLEATPSQQPGCPFVRTHGPYLPANQALSLSA